MRVLLVSPYGANLVGGIANWTKYVVDYHRRHGGDIDLRLLANLDVEQVLVGTTLLKRLLAGIKNYLPVYRLFKETVYKEHFDVAHICSSASFGLIRDLFLVREAQKKGIKTCLHLHMGRIPKIMKSNGWERFILMRLFKQVDAILVMDKVSYNVLIDLGLDSVHYLPNPLSSEVQQTIEKLGVLRREPRKIVFAGHVGVAKGVYDLVKACNELPNIKLELLGKIVENHDMERLFSLGGKDSQKWLSIPGNKTHEEVIKAMLTCSVFVLPSHSEGFPNVILESMACGCPIVATSVGAIPEMLDYESDKPSGVCVQVHNVKDLRDAIVEMLENTGRAMEMGKNAMKRVRELYSMPKVWSQMVNIWRTVIN